MIQSAADADWGRGVHHGASKGRIPSDGLFPSAFVVLWFRTITPFPLDRHWFLGRGMLVHHEHDALDVLDVPVLVQGEEDVPHRAICAVLFAAPVNYETGKFFTRW
jgi:hypothetical protein